MLAILIKFSPTKLCLISGSVSSNDSGHSEALSFCDGNLYHLTSSILHNPPLPPAMMQPPAIQPRRHSTIQGNTGNIYPQSSTSTTNVQSNVKQANGDLNMIPPPPNPRTIPPHPRTQPFPITVPVLPTNNPANGGVPNVAGYNVYAPQHYNQVRHGGK